MKGVVFLLVVMILMVGRGIWVEGKYPGQWKRVIKNYHDSESVGKLFTDIGHSLTGRKIRPVAMSAQDENSYVYRWVDANGEVHITETEPDVEHFEKIRLGDMEFDIRESLPPN